MVSSRIFSDTIPTVVGAAVVSRAVDTGFGRRNGRDGSDSRRTTESGRRISGRGKSGAGGGGGTTHYPANRIKTLCGRKLKDVDHTRVRKNVDCKKCRKALRSMGKLR